MDIKEQDILGDTINTNWYYRAKGAAMTRLLAAKPVRHVLDVGAGSGVFARRLLDQGAATATCVDPAYPREYTEAHQGKPIHFVHAAATHDADTVLLMDVLEHVDDDTALLREYANAAAPGTRFLITVPAFMWMWSGHDVFLEHRRRYTLAQLEKVARDAGLVIDTGCYFYALTLPLAALRRRVLRLLHGPGIKSDLTRPSALINTILMAICAVELVFFRINRIGGLTAVCLANKAK
jgi:SAM-dependent methyltransferase